MKINLTKLIGGLALLGAVASAPAQALLSTLGNPMNYSMSLDNFFMNVYRVDQQFTTGSSGASIGSIDVALGPINPGNTFTVSLYSDNSGSVGSLLANGLFIGPGSLTENSINTFTTSGLTVIPSTTYWLVLANPSTMTTTMQLNATSLPAASSSAGWTLNNAVWRYGDGSILNVGTGDIAPLFAINPEPVPEPSTLAMSALGGLGLLLKFRRRK